MLNYIKSEFYRIRNSTFFKVLFLIYFVFSILACLFLKFASASSASSDALGKLISYSLLIGNLSYYYSSSLFVVYGVSDDNNKNNNLKNTIALGIPREKILFGKFIVNTIITILMMFFVVIVILITSNILFGFDIKLNITLNDIIYGVFAIIPIVILCVIMITSFLEIFRKEMISLLVFLIIFFFLPVILNIIYNISGKEIFYKISQIFPSQFLVNKLDVENLSIHTVWSEFFVFVKCYLVGIIGSIIFGLLGISIFRKREF
ncbi:MAG: ABC transporter permease [Tissierellia bacterium]|nr:ABC transporter permease [Tissierellia bacterium]